MKVIKEFEYDKIGSWKNGNPFTICFVYTKNTSGIIKGGAQQVEDFIKEDIKVPCIAHYTYFYRGQSRRSVCFENFKRDSVFFVYDWDSPGNGLDLHIPVLHVLKINNEQVKKIRRIPRKWMKELDDLK
jgi:hypothetical protein